MHMLKRECITDSISSNKRTIGDVEDGERNYDFDRERDQERSRDRNRERDISKCNHCNKYHPSPCRLLSHPDCNPDASIPFEQSDKGKQWLQKGHRSLQGQLTLDGSVWVNPNETPQFNNGHQGNHPNNRNNNHRGGHNNRHHFKGGRR